MCPPNISAVPGKRGTVLIVEDNSDAAELLSSLVEREGFRPAVRQTAESGLSAFSGEKPVAVLLDWVLPDGPGTEICRAIRTQDANVLIIFVSGRDDETSVVRGLDAGADDYVSKPVRGAELIARIEAHLRKLEAGRGSEHTPERTRPAPLRLGSVTIDLDAHEVKVGAEPARLGALEFKLLAYLLRNSGVAISRDQIMNEVYGYDADISTERVDLLVRRLRAKLGDDDGALIAAVPGFGYRLDRRVRA